MLGLTASVILRGASGGIEKATRILIPLLFILLVVVCIRSLTLPNAMEGLKFLFMPDFSRIDGSVVLMAMGLAFFKMSIGFGCMITYGSYFRSDTHVPFLAVRVMVCDLLVSILAGIAVFPGYVWSRSDALDALTNGGTLHNLACAKAILFLCRYVTPVLIVIILLNGLKVL